MKRLGILALVAIVVGGAFAYGQLASDSHHVIVEMGELYRLVVSRVGTPEKDVHMILDPFEPKVSDDSTRISYFLNNFGPNGTRIIWACTWTARTEWVRLHAGVKWSAGLTPPVGHELKSNELYFCWICLPVIITLLEISSEGPQMPALGWFPEYLTVEYTADQIDFDVPAGTVARGMASFVMEHIP